MLYLCDCGFFAIFAYSNFIAMRRLFLLLLLAVGVDGALCAQEQESPKNTVKATFMSIFSGSTRFTYERALTPRTTAEITFGQIGMGYDWMNDANPTGYVMKLAYKYNLHSSPSTALNGFYVKPELQWANYDYDNKAVMLSDVPRRDHVSRWALMAEGGWQYLFGRFVVDVYVGFGYSWGDENTDNYYHGVMMYPSYDSHLAVTGGCRLGYAF